LRDAYGGVGNCATAVHFQVKLAFQGAVDRLDQLADRL
jgi:hypothetical protein